MVAQETYESHKGDSPEDVVAVNITENTAPDWTEAEELRAKRKLVLVLIRDDLLVAC